MITVIIPTLNEEQRLPATLAALVPAVIDGVVRQVVIADGGSSDRTRDIADHAGADVVHDGSIGRGQQLAAGAQTARGSWLLFLHADTILAPGWHEEAARFIALVNGGVRPASAAVFTFALDDASWRAWVVVGGVALRCRVFKMPYGDQGLLISRKLYDEIGGMRPLPLLEDVDIVHRLGRRRIVVLAARAVTSADRYRRDGYIRRVVRNWTCLGGYLAGVPIERLARRYEGLK